MFLIADSGSTKTTWCLYDRGDGTTMYHQTAGINPYYQTGQEILATLEKVTLSALADRVAAMPGRFDAVLVAAAELMEPEAQFISLPSCTIKTPEDIDNWVQEARKKIEAALQHGPVILH